jgi:hypothetical protein
MQDNDIVRLATAQNPAQAHLWQQALEDEGISSKVVGDMLDVSFGDMQGVTPEIWVHRNDLERASAFLEAHQHATEQPESEED